MPSLSAFVLIVALLAGPPSGPPLLEATLAPEEEFCVECCSLYCAAPPELSVSAHLAPQAAARYAGESASDGLGETAWIVRGGAEEWLQLRFVDGEDVRLSSRLGVDQLFLLNGYGKSDTHWRDHSRIRELELLVDGIVVARIRLLDDPRPQRVALPKTPLHNGLSLRFVVKALYPGTRFAETAVSEVRVDGYGHH